jgi:hypothetical protein
MTTAAVCTSLSGTDDLELQDWVVRDVAPGDVRLVFEREAIGKVVIEMPA